MSRRRKAARSSPAPAKSSLGLPHGDAVPPRRSRGPVDVEVNRRRGAYTAVGYRAQRIAEREGRSPSRSGAIAHERVDRLKLQFQSREFVRTNGLYKGMLFRARSYIVGRGFQLNCRTKSSRWNRKTEKSFRAWWKNADVKGELSGARLEGLVCDELLTCGDLGAIPLETEDGDKIQVVEAEQIIGRKWLDQGVERDLLGRPIRFWVSPYDPNTGVPDTSRAQAHKPSTFFYVSAPERCSSSRSVPPCQSSFAMMHRISDVCDSEAIAWQMQARVALISNRQGNPVFANAVGSARDENRSSGDEDPSGNQFTELDYALIFHGEPGETVTGMERTAPGSAFTEALTMFLRLLGLPLGLPLELILLDWTNSNYSQSRAVLEQAYQTFCAWQDLLIDRFYDRVFEWWLRRRMADGTIEEREDALEHDWTPPTFPWIDQLNEAQAQGEKMDRGFTTHRAVCKSLNTEREDVVEDLKRETLEALAIVDEIEAETGVRVPWEPFAGKKAPINAAPAGATPPGAKPPEKGVGGRDTKPEKSPRKDSAARRRAARPSSRRPRRARSVTGRRQSAACR